jgi:SET domain-containing protein
LYISFKIRYTPLRNTPGSSGKEKYLVVATATREIKKGEEIFFHYG